MLSTVYAHTLLANNPRPSRLRRSVAVLNDGPCQQLECQSRVRIRFLRLQSDRTLHIRNKGPRDGLVKSRISMADTPTAAPYVRLIINTDREPKFAAASNFFLSVAHSRSPRGNARDQ